MASPLRRSQEGRASCNGHRQAESVYPAIMEEPAGRRAVFSSWHLWNVAADAAARAREVQVRHPGASTSDALAAVVLSTSAAEAFINELTWSLCYLPTLTLDSPKWAEVGAILDELEESHTPVHVKYMLASRMLPGVPLRRDAAPFQDFCLLFRVRDLIVHPRPEESERSRKVARALRSRKLDDGSVGNGFVYEVQTPRLARWACRSVHEVIWDMLARFESAGVGPRLFYEPLENQWGKTRVDLRTAET